MLMKRRRLLFYSCVFVLSLCTLLYAQRGAQKPQLENDVPVREQLEYIPAPIPETLFEAGCRGARGGLIDDKETEDLPRPTFDLPNVTFPEPTSGSYEAIGLEKSWLTFDQRYGPYGKEDNSFKRVDWDSVDWGKLQDQCLLSDNIQVYDDAWLQHNQQPVFRLVNDVDGAYSRQGPRRTHRQAIVLRTWETFEYRSEDLWSIRSIISEAALATKGAYTVFLLVDVKRKDGARIHYDDAFYQEVLQQSVPKEFWNIAVLYHQSLLEDWYPKVGEHSPLFQIMQPLQLFAQFYPHFDHYWQLEMDTRFTGDVGKILRSFQKFGWAEPYKQARERSSWTYMPRIHGSFAEFSEAVNASLKGGASFWGAPDIKLKGFTPFGEKPIVSRPEDDDFEWGVDEDADLLILNVLSDVHRFKSEWDWIFKEWYRGIDEDVPRLASVPAQARASRRLLKSVHDAQHQLGVRLPSEATLPSFAIWNGFKVVQVPFPKYQWPERDIRELDAIYNGGSPGMFEDGVAEGLGSYQNYAMRNFFRPRTYEWQSPLPGAVFQWWQYGKGVDEKQGSGGSASQRVEVPNDKMPSFLARVDGKVYAPNLILHPRKTNSYVANPLLGY